MQIEWDNGASVEMIPEAGRIQILKRRVKRSGLDLRAKDSEMRVHRMAEPLRLTQWLTRELTRLNARGQTPYGPQNWR